MRNLVRDDPQLWQPDTYDIVFFRNVLMYFTPESAQAVIARIGRALKPGGYLFLGHAETLRGLSSDFHLRHTHETFYYQRKDAAGAAQRRTRRQSRRQRGLAPTVVAAVEGADTWIDAIRQGHRAHRDPDTLAAAVGVVAPGIDRGSRQARRGTSSSRASSCGRSASPKRSR